MSRKDRDCDLWVKNCLFRETDRRPLSLFLLSPARQHSRTQRSSASFSISQLYLLASIIKRNTSPAHQSGIVAFNAWAKQRIIRQKVCDEQVNDRYILKGGNQSFFYHHHRRSHHYPEVVALIDYSASLHARLKLPLHPSIHSYGKEGSARQGNLDFHSERRTRFSVSELLCASPLLITSYCW